MIKFSIIIPTYKLPLPELQKNLNSVINYTDLADKEIIVVANGQSEEVLSFLRDKANIKLLEYPEPLGYSKAVNQGILASKGKYVVLLNDDVELLDQEIDQWLMILEEPFWTDDRVAITGPLTAQINLDEKTMYEFVLFFCAMIRKDRLVSVGLLDEGFGPGGYEDVDWCIRAQKSGFIIKRVPINQPVIWREGTTLYTGTFPIYHEGSYTMSRLENANDLYEKNFERLKAKALHKGEGFIVGKYDEPYLLTKPRYIVATEYIKEFIAKNYRKPKVIEIGCGSGVGLKYISEYIEEYLGVDYDEEVLRFAQIEFGNEKIRFEKLDLQTEQQKLINLLKDFDIVICYETLEHIDNLHEIYNLIALYSSNFLVSVPYNEPEDKKWWAHKHIKLTEKDFSIPDVGVDFVYQSKAGELFTVKPADEQRIATMIIKKKMSAKRLKILAYVVTRNRWQTTLMLTISSLLNQKRVPDRVVVISDDDNIEWKNHPFYQMLKVSFAEKGVDFEIIPNKGKGQVAGHQYVNSDLGKNFDYVWRIDDDEVAEANVLEEIERFILMNPEAKIGGVGPSVVIPGYVFDYKQFKPSDFGVEIKDIHLPNIQWSNYPLPVEVQHLHSTFVYKPGIVNYPKNLSRIGHREETMFTFRLYKTGYKLFALPFLRVWHYQNNYGGIRSEQDGKLWEKDEQVFKEFLRSYSIELKEPKFIGLANGLGDLFAFKQVLPEILQKHKDKSIYLCCDAPQVFEDFPGIRFISVAMARRIVPDFEDLNVYGWMSKNKWDKSIVEAFRSMYG